MHSQSGHPLKLHFPHIALTPHRRGRIDLIGFRGNIFLQKFVSPPGCASSPVLAPDAA